MKRLIYFSTFIFILVSCEYKLEETNYRDIEPPSDNAYIEINLTNVHPSDTIYIWKPTTITISFNTQYTIYQVEVKIGSRSFSVRKNSNLSFSFDVDPKAFDRGDYKLQLNCITNSGTKSLADILGYEGYQFEGYWNIKISNQNPDFKYGYRFNDDGLLELFWNSTSEIGIQTIKHVVQRISNDGYFRAELGPYQNSVIINDYVCGKSIYSICTFCKFNGEPDWHSHSYCGTIIVDTPIPSVFIEDIDNNKIRIYWDKPLVSNAKFKVNYPQYMNTVNFFITKIMDISDTTVFIQKPPVGSQFNCTVEFYLNEYKENYHYASSEAYFFYGKKVGFETHNSWYLYNKIENVVYTVKNDSIAVIDANTLDFRHVNSGIGIYYNYLISNNSSKFAIFSYDKIVIYENSNLINPNILNIQLQDNSSYTLSDEFLFEFNELACNVYDLSTSSLLNSYPPIGYNVKMSIDGRYFACNSRDNINYNDIFTFNFVEFDNIATLDRIGYIFHPNHPDKIIIEDYTHNYKTVDIFQLPQFEKIQSTNIPWNNRIINIDPVTELVLLSNNYYDSGWSISGVAIAPLYDLNNILYTSPGDFHLYNGHLFSDHGYAVDIRKELSQP